MASIENSRSFRLYVTHVDGEGHFLRISGQRDQQFSHIIKSLFQTARENLENGIGAATPGLIYEGLICAAKCQDGTYYRVKVNDMSSIANGLVGVNFIDFGNEDIISLRTIRFLDSYDPMFLQLRGQASDYYLSRVINPSGWWEKPFLLKLQSLLCYSEHHVSLDVHTQSLPLISIQFNGNDLSTYLASIRFGLAIPIEKQEFLLLQAENPHAAKWQPSYLTEVPAFSEHMPCLAHQNFSANPASAMCLQQNVSLPFIGSIPAAPSLIRKRLTNTRVSRNNVNLMAPTCQPQQGASSLILSGPPPATTAPPFAAGEQTSPIWTSTYKSKLLGVGSQHRVLVSYADEGPELFAVQLASEGVRLQQMMDDIKRRPHKSLTKPPMIGTACLCRLSNDHIICRAAVTNLSGFQCKLCLVDFGDTEMISYNDIFDIPEEFVKPDVFAMRFCLSGAKKLEKGPLLNEIFQQLASGKLMTLKVVPPEGPPLIQYGELYLDDMNILDLLMAKLKNKLQCKSLGSLPLETKHIVLVSYVDSCTKFYIQLSHKIDELNAVMDAVKVHCENSSSPGELPVGSPCCARFPEDGNWYRARVKSVKDGRIIVAYVDYGNEQEVHVSDLRTITPDLLKLPAAAIKCALKGFENKPVESNTSQLETLALEKTFMCHLVGVLSSDTMLVTLIDYSTSPPLDIAQKMAQHSQPRSSHEIKPTVRKDAPDSFSTPEGIVPSEDRRRRSSRREKGFEDERRRDAAEQQRGFQAADNRLNQEDCEESRNDDCGNRTGGRPDRRDYRGGDNRGERRHSGDRGPRRDFGSRDRNDFNKGRNDVGNRDRNNFNKDSNDFGNRARSLRDGRSDFTPRDCAGRSFDDKRQFIPRSKFTQVQYKEIADPVPLETPFQDPTVEMGTQHEISVTWIISPESFYAQILSLQPKFLEMMHKIPELYKGVKPFSGTIPVGASVLARYPVDGVLYRATVICVQPFSKFIVRFIDFGNKQLVDVSDIWQLDRELMELPRMAVHCSLIGVGPKDGEWKPDTEIDFCFDAPRYQCAFQEIQQEQYKVFLWNNGVSVAETLVEKQLAVSAEHQSSATLKDEPIDLPITVGQRIVCRVTHVECFDKFTVQLDIEKAALLERTIATYDQAQLTPPAPELIVEGAHCTVRHEDKICRAMIQHASDDGNITVTALLADYGNVITTSVDNVLILPAELSVYYYQALQCTLSNYTAESEALISLDEMKAKLVGNKFIVHVNDVDGITLVTTLYDATTGQKVAIFTPDEGAYDAVAPLCPRAVFNYSFGVAYISHAENLNEFYVQKSSDGDRLALLLADLYKFYQEGTPEALENIKVDALCAAHSSDDNWYRATVISVEDEQVKVQFTDYGNSEIVTKDSLKKLDCKFYEPCHLALVASLGLVALQDDALTKLMEWTTEKEVQVTLSLGSDGWLANLHLNGLDLSMKLIKEKLATPQIADSDVSKQEAPTEEPISLLEGCTQMYISHIDTPGHFWLQAVDNVDKIDEIQAELQANADSYANIENSEMGTLCVAKYLAGDQWYRAEILDFDSDITTARFIDYGNIDVLDNQPGLIKVIPDSLKEVERFAIKSSVNAVPTGTREWSEAASEHFTQVVGDLPAPVDVLFVLKDVTTYVDIFVHGVNVTDKLVSRGYATRFEVAECSGDLPSCFACHVKSPTEFWIQLESATPDLRAIEAAMVDAESFPEFDEKAEGVICAAKYPEDGAWYRAQVIIDGSEGTEVLLMDYGNASITNELRSLPDDLKIKPALSRKCALQKPRDIKSWSRKSETKFNELAAEGATIFKVQLIASGDISIVELYLEGKSVTGELVALCEEQPAAERPAPLGQDMLSDAKVCYVQSLDEFYVQLEENTSEIDRVTEAIGGAANFNQISELKVGSICAAFWAKDEQWYRAKVLEFCDVGYHVQFIDYGNKAKCEEFRKLPDDLATIEPLAECCRLAGAPADKSLHEIGRNKFDELALEYVTFQIEYLDRTKEPTLVKVLVDGTDLVLVLVDGTDLGKETPADSQISAEMTNVEQPVSSIPAEDEEQTEPKVDLQKEVVEVTITDIEPTKSTPEQEETLTDIKPTKSTPEVVYTSMGEIILETIDKDVDGATVQPEHNDSKDKDDEFDDAEDGLEADQLNTSQTNLKESLDSTHTAIENKAFDAQDNDLVLDENVKSSSSVPESDEVTPDEGIKTETPTTPEKNASSRTLDSSNDAIKTPERDISKESSNSDTGYASSVDQDKSSEKVIESPIYEQMLESANPEAKKIESP